MRSARARWWGNLGRHGMTVSRDSFCVLARWLGAVWLGVVLGGCWRAWLAGPAEAETLREALNAAYKFNPRLDAARANQRATDEEVPRALSGYRPSITGTADTGYQLQSVQGGRGNATRESKPRGYEVGAVQPLFRGFRTKNAVSAAEASVRQGCGGAALDRELGAAGGGDGLLGRGARPGDPHPAREQRHGADARSQGHAGPLRGWRGDAHGRGSGAGAQSAARWRRWTWRAPT